MPAGSGVPDIMQRLSIASSRQDVVQLRWVFFLIRFDDRGFVLRFMRVILNPLDNATIDPIRAALERSEYCKSVYTRRDAST